MSLIVFVLLLILRLHCIPRPRDKTPARARVCVCVLLLLLLLLTTRRAENVLNMKTFLSLDKDMLRGMGISTGKCACAAIFFSFAYVRVR